METRIHNQTLSRVTLHGPKLTLATFYRPFLSTNVPMIIP